MVIGNRAQLKAGELVVPKVMAGSAGSARVMSRFSIRNPYFIIVVCLIVVVIGLTSVVRMPVDLFPDINIPQVVVATFYNGMPPEQIETDITGRFERFFTLGAGIDHMESRSLPGVSIIKVFFQPGTSADSDVTEISNLAMADLRRLPPGTLPPIVQKFDASSLPVCLITLKGQGLNETQLRDLGQFAIRNQLAGVSGRLGAAAVRREVPPDHGVRRPIEAAGVSDEPDGRGARGQQRQPHPAVGRRQDRPVRLHASSPTASSGTSRTSIASRSRRRAIRWCW